jgi:hypothetical protein
MVLTKFSLSFDLSVASRTGQPPHLPFRRGELPRRIALGDGAVPDGTDAPGFGIVQYINISLHATLQQAAYATTLLDHRNIVEPQQADISFTKLLTKTRNEVQHSLLAMPMSSFPISAFAPIPDPGGGGGITSSTSSTASNPSPHLTATQNLALSELTRLAALIYNDLVLFPMSSINGIRPRLAARIKGVLETSQLLHSTQLTSPSRNRDRTNSTGSGSSSTSWATSVRDLLLWILWFGAFAAHQQSELQDWFEQRLGSFIGEKSYGRARGKGRGTQVSFEEVRELLQRFLWWGFVCDAPGRELCGRVQARPREEV